MNNLYEAFKEMYKDYFKQIKIVDNEVYYHALDDNHFFVLKEGILIFRWIK